jgi:hypothetical protein
VDCGHKWHGRANRIEERTIESQVLALKKPIEAAGHVLVKEYIDNGRSAAVWSGNGCDRH